MKQILIRWTLVGCLYILVLPTLLAQVKATGVQYYDLEQWDKAIESFEQEIANQGARSDLYYNLGRTYHEVGKIPQAILAYERCLVLEPTHGDARRGLHLAIESTKDRLYDGQGLLRSLGDKVAYTLSRTVWQSIALIFFAGVMICAILFVRTSERRNKRVCFYFGLGFLVLCLISNAMIAHQDYYQAQSLGRGVLLKDVVSVYPEPVIGGLPIFVLHAGTSCRLDGESEQGAQHITLSDGRSGWIDETSVESIAFD